MSGVPEGKRSKSPFMIDHHFSHLEDSVFELMENGFGYSQLKFDKKIERYKNNNRSSNNLEKIVDYYAAKTSSYYKRFIRDEQDKVNTLLYNIRTEFRMANSIYVSNTPAREQEFIERRIHLDNAIEYCYALIGEIQYALKNLPVDFNKSERFAVEINTMIDMLKNLRDSDRSAYNKHNRSAHNKNIVCNSG